MNPTISEIFEAMSTDIGVPILFMDQGTIPEGVYGTYTILKEEMEKPHQSIREVQNSGGNAAVNTIYKNKYTIKLEFVKQAPYAGSQEGISNKTRSAYMWLGNEGSDVLKSKGFLPSASPQMYYSGDSNYFKVGFIFSLKGHYIVTTEIEAIDSIAYEINHTA